MLLSFYMSRRVVVAMLALPFLGLLGLGLVYARKRRANGMPLSGMWEDLQPGKLEAAAVVAAITTRVPPFFILVGDSTTASQAHDGGGWGTGFLSSLVRGARGVNMGVNGATSGGYRMSYHWSNALDLVRSNARIMPVFVTIQFGHNDQSPSSGITLAQYQAYLVKMAREVLEAGGTPILVTPLSRRNFEPIDSDNKTVVDDLHDQRLATLAAYAEVSTGWTAIPATTTSATTIATTAINEEKSHFVPPLPPRHPHCIDLNAASKEYVNTIGRDAAQEYNLNGPGGFDTTHLNDRGSVVFGRMVADLILGHPPALVKAGERDTWTPGSSGGDGDDGYNGLSSWIRPDPMLSGLVWHGKLA